MPTISLGSRFAAALSAVMLSVLSIATTVSMPAPAHAEVAIVSTGAIA